jgi:hypothetical protein
MGQVLDYYMDILQNSQIYLQEKNQLNDILSGLEHCLSLLTNKGIDTDNMVSAQVSTSLYLTREY